MITRLLECLITPSNVSVIASASIFRVSRSGPISVGSSFIVFLGYCRWCNRKCSSKESRGIQITCFLIDIATEWHEIGLACLFCLFLAKETLCIGLQGEIVGL